MNDNDLVNKNEFGIKIKQMSEPNFEIDLIFECFYSEGLRVWFFSFSFAIFGKSYWEINRVN